MFLKYPLSILLGLILTAGSFSVYSTVAFAQDSHEQTTENEQKSYRFTKKHYSINGEAKIVETASGAEIFFSENFETRSGPDLKVYLSKLPLSELNDSIVDQSSLKIGVLKSKGGAQSYSLPQDISLKDYKSVVIHCEAFSKLWGGFDL